MSRSTPHRCAEPGCPTILEDGPGRCQAHHGTGRPGSPGYGWAWRRIRNAYIAEHPRCERCPAPALDVHHRDGRSPLEAGANEWRNLEALCRSCHRRATEDARLGRDLDARSSQRRAHLAYGPETARSRFR